MAQFTHTLCEEVIRTNGRCGLTSSEKVQMARLALRTLKNSNPVLLDAMRYRRLRENWIDCDELGLHGRLAVIDARLDEFIYAAPQGSDDGATPQRSAVQDPAVAAPMNEADVAPAAGQKE